jgi:hypothetical protein
MLKFYIRIITVKPAAILKATLSIPRMYWLFKIVVFIFNPKKFLGSDRNLIMLKNTYNDTSMTVTTWIDDCNWEKSTRSIMASKAAQITTSENTIIRFLIDKGLFWNF